MESELSNVFGERASTLFSGSRRCSQEFSVIFDFLSISRVCGVKPTLYLAIDLVRELRHWYFRSLNVLACTFEDLLWVHLRVDSSNDSCGIPGSHVKWWHILPSIIVSRTVPGLIGIKHHKPWSPRFLPQ